MREFFIDKKNSVYYCASMKPVSLVLLIALALMALLPAAAVYPCGGSPGASIHVLDVCHGTATGMNIDTPFSIHERPCCPLPSQLVVVQKLSPTHFKPLLIAFQDERPPRV